MKKFNILLLVAFITAIVAMFYFFDYSSKKKYEVKYPFFLSTKYTTTNIRSGPGEEFPVIGAFKAKNIPIKIIASYKEWYQMEDYSGKIGWIYKNIVSKKSTALTKKRTSVYLKMDKNSRKVATIDKEVLVFINKIKDQYVQITLTEGDIKIKGWVIKESLWGL